MQDFPSSADMAGRTALITGGAGHLGRAMGAILAEAGATVILADRSDEALAAARASESTGRLKTYRVDLEDEQARSEMPAWVRDQIGSLDVLINNAAFVGDSQLQGWVTSFEEQTLSTWRRAIEVNLTAPFHLCQLFTPLLRASGRGSIVNIGSIYGMVGPDMSLYDGLPMGNPAGYAASKGGLIQLTRWLATTLGPDIRVNSLSPGGIARGQPAAFAERYVARTPLGRMGTEEDFKGATLFLASDLSRWVTGQNIMVDGGWTAW
jgi:NAD(P)-dependent dehydrogenase (short-subunit alcohol dehydrogenase family)